MRTEIQSRVKDLLNSLKQSTDKSHRGWFWRVGARPGQAAKGLGGLSGVIGGQCFRQAAQSG